MISWVCVNRTAKVVEITAAPVNRAAVIDEYGRLQCELKALEPKKKRRDQLAATIRRWYDDADSNKEFCETGERFAVVVKAKREERSIRSIWAVARRIGWKAFMLVALKAFPLNALDERLAPAEVEALVTRDRTGYRPLEVEEIAIESVA
jgi:hypothetical protein